MTIEVNGLHFWYRPDREVLSAIKFQIAKGERVALLGRNGSGKSTLVKHLNGLLKPERGTVSINGVATDKTPVAALAAKVGLAFQNPDDQICKSTVWEEAAFGPRNLGYDEWRVESLVEAALNRFGLFNLKDTNPHDLGFGERKRLSLASVVAMDTDTVVFDEPTAGLDPREANRLKTILEELSDMRKTIILISHDMDFVAETMDRAICLDKGLQQFDGPLTKLFTSPDLVARCGLLLPQVVRLASHFSLRPTPMTPHDFMDVFGRYHKNPRD